MFVNAIERAAEFTRAIHTITRVWGTERIVPGSATLFFVNSDGWALTCGHVAKQIMDGDQIGIQFDAFKEERAKIGSGKGQKHEINQLERKYGFKHGQTVQLHVKLLGCVDGVQNLDMVFHPTLDVALLKFQGFNKLLCDNFPVFARDGDGLKQGKSICRLGFPFPEFTNYGYDSVTDSIGWTNVGQQQTPRFPLDGIVVRHVGDTAGEIIAFEVSTPGIRGQSGGPAFDVDGRVWGMQSMTKHLDLEFDIDVEVHRGTTKRRVQAGAFLHIGGCIHINALKAFMHENNVKFQEG